MLLSTVITSMSTDLSNKWLFGTDTETVKYGVLELENSVVCFLEDENTEQSINTYFSHCSICEKCLF